MSTPDDAAEKKGGLLSSIFFWVIVIGIFYLFLHYKESVIEIPDTENRVVKNTAGVETSEKSAKAETSAAPRSISKVPGEGSMVMIPWSNLIETAPVNDILIDPSGTVWAATEKGLTSISNEIKRDFSQDSGSFPVPQAECLAHDGNKLIIGTLFGLFSRDKQGKVELIGEDQGIKNEIIWSLDYDGSTVWVGTQDGFAFRSKSGRFNVIDGKISNGGLRNLWCQHIYKFANWLVVSNDKGLSIWNTTFKASNPDIWKNIDYIRAGIQRPVTGLAFDGKRLWLSTTKGIFALTTSLQKIFSGSVSNFVNYTEVHGLPSNHVNAIVAQNGSLWIGTNTGLARLKDDQIKIVNPTVGHFSSLIRALAISGDILWIGTDKGIHYINTAMVD